MTTKEQERKALEQIKKIVSALGKNSYVATAFEGCFEDAENNIEDDAAYSMKDRLESLSSDNWEQRKQIGELKKEIKALEDANSVKDKQIEALSARRDDLLNQVSEGANKCIENWNKYREQEDRAEALEIEVMKLKAKLYDFMTKEA